jgi:hypothetical protein
MPRNTKRYELPEWFKMILSSAVLIGKHAALHIPKGRSIRKYGAKQTGNVLRVCPGGRHAWIESPIGVIRKPYPIN